MGITMGHFGSVWVLGWAILVHCGYSKLGYFNSVLVQGYAILVMGGLLKIQYGYQDVFFVFRMGYFSSVWLLGCVNSLVWVILVQCE